jgi:hypothetical protein
MNKRTKNQKLAGIWQVIKGNAETWVWDELECIAEAIGDNESFDELSARQIITFLANKHAEGDTLAGLWVNAFEGGNVTLARFLEDARAERVAA